MDRSPAGGGSQAVPAVTFLLDWSGAAKLRRSGRNWIGPCPSCGYRDAFVAWSTNRGIRFHCHAGCDWRDVLAVLRNTGLAVATDPLLGPAPPSMPNRTTMVHRLWNGSQPTSGTVVDAYFRARCLPAPAPSDLRYLQRHRHTPTGTYWPVLLAAVRDVAGNLVAVHRTYLRHDGLGKAPVEQAKMSLGPLAGAAVRLSQGAPHLLVGEGIESTLSAMVGSGLPGWAALSTGGLRKLVLPPLPLASKVTIAADDDPPGQAAAIYAAHRWVGEGRAVSIAMPPAPHKDWNDALRKETIDA